MTQDSGAFFQKEFQEGLAIHAIRCPRLLQYLYDGKLTSDDFDINTHKVAIYVVVDILRAQHGVNPAPSIDVIGVGILPMIRSGKVLQQEVNDIVRFLSVAFDAQIHEEFYLSHLQNFLAHQRVNRVLTQAKSPMGRPGTFAGDPASIAANVQRAYESSLITQKNTGMPLLNFRFRAPLQMVPTGMPAIDQNLGGGLGKKKFGLVCGQTGLGKTALGINFAVGAARLGFRAVIASLEIPEEEMFSRIYANVARYPYDLILKGDRTGARTYEEIQAEVQQRVIQNFGNSCGNLAIWDMSDGTTPRTVAGLKKKLMDDRAAGFAPDVLIVDWLDIMDLSDISKKSSPIKEVRHKLQKNAEELDQMARDENIAIWSMTQANSQADGKSKVTMKNNSEGYAKSFKASVFLGVGASYQDREENIFTVTCSKARDGRLFTCRIRALLDQQRFEEIDDTTTDPLSQMIASPGDLAARTDFSALTT